MGKLGQAQAWRNEFRGGGPGLEGPYGKGTQAPMGPQSVCKNSKLPKKQHKVSQNWANFRNIGGPSVPPKR